MDGNKNRNNQTLLTILITSLCFVSGYSIVSWLLPKEQGTITIYPDEYFNTVTTGNLYEESPTNLGTREVKGGNIKKQQTSGISTGYKGETKIKSGILETKVQTGKQYTIKVIHKGFKSGDLAQKYVQYAREISKDKDFIYTLQQENGSRELNKQSNIYLQWNGKKNIICTKENRTNKCSRERSFGLCQLNRKRHSKIIDDPRFFTDYKYHIDQCREKYKNGTKFYGWNNRQASIKRFTFN